MFSLPKEYYLFSLPISFPSTVYMISYFRFSQTSRPSEDLLIQFSKVLVGLSSDRYPEQRKQILMAMDEENRKLFEQGVNIDRCKLI